MEIAGESHKGYVRRLNEDRIDWDEQAGVAAVADGLGSLPFGEVAARLAVETVLRVARNHHGSDHTWLESGGDPEDLVHLANRSVLSYTERDRRYEGMGTTLSLLCEAPDEVAIAHVGDSRVYRLRDGELQQITTDHKPLQHDIDDGTVKRSTHTNAPQRNILERALGAVTWTEPDVLREPRKAGDVYLLCSNGLTAALSDQRIQAHLEKAAQGENLDDAANALVQEALEAGGGADNISVVLARL